MPKWGTTNYIEVYTFFFFVDRIKGALAHVVIVPHPLKPYSYMVCNHPSNNGDCHYSNFLPLSHVLEWYIEVFTR